MNNRRAVEGGCCYDETFRRIAAARFGTKGSPVMVASDSGDERTSDLPGPGRPIRTAI
jgi:hypothetical protein